MLVNGDRMLAAVLRDIDAARSSIHISMFLWFRDQVGKEVAEAVMRKAREGVAARVLLNVQKTAMGDPFSTGEKTVMKLDPSMKDDPHDVEPMCRELRDAGVEVVDTNIDYDHVSSSLEPRLRSIAAQIRDTIAIDDLHIDHRKLILIDGRIGYSGGANIGVQYMYHEPFDPKLDAHGEAEARIREQRPEPWLKWHDSLTRFVGPIVDDLEHHFHERFVLDGGQDYELSKVDHAETPQAITSSSEACGSMEIASARVFCNEPNDRPNAVRELYVRMIREATRSIFIENPYLYHPAIVEALCEAKRARPDLEVTLVLPAGKWNDNSFAFDAQQHEYARYLEHGIAVHEYQCHFTHLKLAVFDDRWSIHGSTNGNFRSLEDDKDFELVVLVDSEPFARWIRQNVRDVDISHARAITHEDVHHALKGFRVRHRDPRTMLLYSRREL
ncbi:MAG TPA: phosphatidylserine/phosphatidylglycerophosphate/cardiolipin synthase family protein [Polyangiales bacterium]|nr:phosphatidylserine/phosphatidylglycerophosphate/cardiolipin synthase family protein [Polyangiales bacterium]